MQRPGRAALLVAALVWASALTAHEAHEPAEPAPPRARFEPPAPGTYELPPIGRVSEHWLLDGRGERAPMLDLHDGEAVFVSFIYLSCGHACPMATARMQQLDRLIAGQPNLSQRVKLVTVSFDPARDTPERMAEQGKLLAPRGRWSFMTAPSAEQIRPILEDFGQDASVIPGPDGEPSGLLRHVLKVFLVDGSGAIRNIYSTGLMDPRILLNDAITVTSEHGA